MVTTTDLDFRNLFPRGARIPCHDGMELLRLFAAARPNDFPFLRHADLNHTSNSAFQGIDEWDAFAEHYVTCKQCHGR